MKSVSFKQIHPRIKGDNSLAPRPERTLRSTMVFRVLSALGEIPSALRGTGLEPGTRRVASL